MASKMTAVVVVREDGSIEFTINDANGKAIGGGGTRRGNLAPKNPVKTACRGVERLLKELLAQKKH